MRSEVKQTGWNWSGALPIMEACVCVRFNDIYTELWAVHSLGWKPVCFTSSIEKKSVERKKVSL